MLKAATLHLEQKNYGLCRVALDELLAAEPGHAEGSAILVQLEERLKPRVAPAAEAGFGAAGAPLQGAAPPGAAQRIAQPPLEREPFQPPPPVTTTVSRITAKLKKLKSSGSRESDGKAAPALEEASKEGEKAHTSTTSNAALKSAASKLKALAGKKAQETTGGLGAPLEPALERDGEENALAEAGAPAAPAPRPETSLPAGPSPPPGGDGGGSTGSAPPTATQKLKLGTSASKLAALRKQAP
jgi:hypothetical protein